MKLFVLNDTTTILNTPQSILDSPTIYGVSIDIPMSNFMMGGSGFNNGFMSDLKKEIKRIASYEKKVSISTIWGNSARNIMGVSYVSLIESAHEGSGQSHGISVPVPFGFSFLNYIGNFLTWLSTELKKDSAVYDAIDSIKVTGVNQQTPEMRIPDQDITGGDSYMNAAIKWQNPKYLPATVENTMNYIVLYYKTVFPDKTLILPIISSLAGFPCITNSGAVCKPNYRPDTTKDVVLLYAQPNDIMCGWCYLNPTSVAPSYISSHPAYYQTQNIVPATREDLDKTIQNGVNQNGEIIEMQYKIFKKYPI